ncbi:similar to Saccharomyces cerevisiae YLR060W FRS1 Beta subunit of cytoplasmic phenylalanyl-tRNA synthetase, forms a tetramer with Frs2p to generate active enzyme [Maudiozyma saulgeensis]|uniref:Phenylalanine--tRNA ligase beta subunit n=1 Tax=Maudiozyma saulgeensis TaxID=1789683 RepID=A0A1X7QYP8_9SACH|nr:similar to Saccharomyces cerevisiae YLR060W FRS1 Beta subunit of cytoplasmic phenylalanyl-tRNA synthetase, forms a tetramer with Frs2p to generate active enzyme [Kazachstania saulgeensis]
MPTISVNKQQLFDLLGKNYTNDEFDELCFEFGVELDEDTTEEALKTGEEPELKIEIGANRYDLLCIEGIAQSLNEYLGRAETPKYKLLKPTTKLIIDKETEQIRPYAAAAVLRNIKFTEKSYASFISLQDKLHSNLCRNRSLVAMGTHDLDTVKGPFHYRALPPKDIKFIPLNQTKEFNGEELIEFYKTPEQKNNIGRFTHIIENSPVFPVIMDDNDTVCSLPPLINSEHSKISLETRNVLIDITATDKTKAEVVLETLCAMFSRYCDEPFSIEPVEIVSEHNGQSRMVPKVEERVMDVSIPYINSALGLEQTPEEIAACLKKLSLHAVVSPKDDAVLSVSIPMTRSDILHPCDIMEDAAIGYGYNNLPKGKQLANASFVASALPINKISDIFRLASSQASWLEVMALTLCSHDENFKFLKTEDDNTKAVKLANPKTLEYQVVRTTLLPGLLKTVKENRKHTLPIKVFESGDVVFKNEALERKAYNERHWGAIYVGKNSGFEIIQGLLGKIMQTFRTQWIADYGAASTGRGYWIEQDDSIKTYFPGRGAKVMFRSKEGEKAQQIGHLGVLHPEVMNNFDVPFAASYVELNSEVFL